MYTYTCHRYMCLAWDLKYKIRKCFKRSHFCCLTDSVVTYLTFSSKTEFVFRICYNSHGFPNTWRSTADSGFFTITVFLKFQILFQFAKETSLYESVKYPGATQANSVKRTLDDAPMSLADLELVPPNQILSFSHRLYIFQKTTNRTVTHPVGSSGSDPGCILVA